MSLSDVATGDGLAVDAHPEPRRRALVAAPVGAAVALAAAAIVTSAAGVPLRDPKGVTVGRLAVTCALLLAFVAGDTIVRAVRAHRSPATLLRDRWPGSRICAALVVLVSFYVTYFAYRNLKSVVPLIRPDALYDRGLTNLDRDVLAGHHPGAALHSLLGTGFSAHALSDVYMFFFPFIPLLVAGALALFRDRDAGLFLVTALGLTWLLGAVSYYVFPSIGPFHAEPGTFAHLPTTAVTHLQERTMAERAAFLHDPSVPGSAQSIGAFASLHVAIEATAAIGATMLRAPRPVQIALWTLTALTALATVYFGWHYLLDDVAGVAISAGSLAIARAVAGGVPRREAARA